MYAVIKVMTDVLMKMIGVELFLAAADAEAEVMYAEIKVKPTNKAKTKKGRVKN